MNFFLQSCNPSIQIICFLLPNPIYSKNRLLQTLLNPWPTSEKAYNYINSVKSVATFLEGHKMGILHHKMPL